MRGKYDSVLEALDRGITELSTTELTGDRGNYFAGQRDIG